MASISFLVCGTEYSLLLLVISGLSSLPAAWCQYCNCKWYVYQNSSNIEKEEECNYISKGMPWEGVAKKEEGTILGSKAFIGHFFD